MSIPAGDSTPGDPHAQSLSERLQQEMRVNAQWTELFDGVTDPIFIHDAEFRVVRANAAYAARAGMSLAAMVGRPYWTVFPRRDGPLPDCERALDEKNGHSHDQFTLPGGEVFRSRAFALFDGDEHHRLSVHILEDITAQVAMERSLVDSEHKFRLVTESIRDGFWLGSPDMERLDYVSPAFERICGIDTQTLLQSPQSLWAAVYPDDLPAVRRFAAVDLSQERDLQYRLLHSDGSLLWVHDRRFPVRDDGRNGPRVAGVITDITAQRQYQERLRYQSTHDALTALPNRALVLDRLAQAIARAQRHEYVAAVLFVDIDRFKVINDSLGHSAGDHLLCVIAERLRSCLRADDTVARHGGDEFVVILNEAKSHEELVGTVRRILATVAEPVDWHGQSLQVSASIGISLFPRDGDDGETLLRNADAAMYQSKERGRNTYTLFSPELNIRVQERLSLEGQMRLALSRGEFVLHYQPQVDLSTGYVTGVEALLRWQHPQLGLLGPAHFIALAEETDLISPIGAWVLRTACGQMVQWQHQGLGALQVSVNLSVRQLHEPGFAQRVEAVLEQTGLEPTQLELELTESLLMDDSVHALEELNRLKARGVRLALDDFGTGYSSLAYLQRYPFDTLKIDRAFIQDVVSNPEDATIARTIIAMAHALGMKVVGEGVERESQAHYLRRNFCDQMQGYWYSKPLAAEAAFERLTSCRCLSALANNDTARERGTLLIVDDEPNVVRALERLLRKDGYHIIAAHSAAEGFEMLALYGAAVVISDQRMPKMGGVEFLSKVKDIHPDTVRLVLTGYPTMDTITGAINSGAIYKFLSKPWQGEELVQAVRDAFRYSQRRAQSGRFG